MVMVCGVGAHNGLGALGQTRRRVSLADLAPL